MTIECAEDSYFCISSLGCEYEMQDIVNLCTQIHGETRRKVQEKKFMLCSWIWKNNKTQETEK